MVSSLSLLAASLLLGQTGPPPVSPAPAPAAKTYVYSNGVLVPYNAAQRPAIVSEAPAEGRRPFLARLQGWFGKRASGTPTAPPATLFPTETAPPPILGPSPTQRKNSPSAPATAPTSTELPRKMPFSLKGTSAGNDTISPATLKTMPVPATSPILPANATRIGRDDKFAWVTGQLEMEKGQYVLYYATPETVDAHHGRILLNAQKVDMRAYHSGDLVSVRGTLHAGRGAPIYLLTSADLIDKAKR